MRFVQLDSLRGLAALSVFFFHLTWIFPISNTFHTLVEYSPLRLMFSGSESVILFFVLSGFVLSLPFYKEGSTIPISSFLIKRILRIYTPFLFTLVMTIALHNLTYSGSILELTESFNNIWSGNIHLSVMLNEASLMVGQISNLNPVTWSLIHEMRISLIFPILMLLVSKLSFKWNVALAVSFSVLSISFFQLTKLGNDGVQFTNTLHYISVFILGAVIAKHLNKITNFISSLTKGKKVAILATSLFVYLYAKPSFVIGYLFDANAFYKALCDSWAVSIGAIGLIAMSMSSIRMGKILSTSFIKKMGDYSYSIYLIHMPMSFTLIHMLYGIIPNWAIVLIIIPTVILISSFMYHYIEKPSIKLGKKLTSYSLRGRGVYKQA